VAAKHSSITATKTFHGDERTRRRQRACTVRANHQRR
jgi:hypothetical protein